MSESEAETAFLLEGVKRYAAVVETTRSFQQLVWEHLAKSVASFASAAFTPSKPPVGGGVNDGTWGHALWVTQAVVLPSDPRVVAIEVGLWWRDVALACYANFQGPSGKAVDFTYECTHPRIAPRLWSKSARLFMRSSPERCLASDELAFLLDELVRSFEVHDRFIGKVQDLQFTDPEGNEFHLDEAGVRIDGRK